MIEQEGAESTEIGVKREDAKARRGSWNLRFGWEGSTLRATVRGRVRWFELSVLCDLLLNSETDRRIEQEGAESTEIGVKREDAKGGREGRRVEGSNLLPTLRLCG